jgi:hypothetical protein
MYLQYKLARLVGEGHRSRMTLTRKGMSKINPRECTYRDKYRDKKKAATRVSTVSDSLRERSKSCCPVEVAEKSGGAGERGDWS